MKSNLIKALNEMDEVDYMELFHSLSLARRIRVMLRENNKELSWLADRLGINEADSNGLINGCFPFNLRTISKLDAIELQLKMEQTKTDHGEWLTFPDYKYSKKLGDEPLK